MRILVAEDDTTSRRLLEANLTKWGHEVLPVQDGDAAWGALQEPGAPRLVLLDWMMPGMDGVEVCQALRQQEGRPFTYVIMLTAKDDKADIAQALNSGADDYLTKPWNPIELQARLGVGERIVRLNAELEEANRELVRLATTDVLTGIWNRGTVMDRAGQELARARREQFPLCFVMMDVDHFKNVNDTHGHAAGDTVLAETAARLRKVCRVYDLLGRYGGEEFLAVFPRLDWDEARSLTERLRASIAREPFETGGTKLAVTMSLGAVWTEPEVPDSIESLIKAADALLYHAKQTGRNRVVISDHPDTTAEML